MKYIKELLDLPLEEQRGALSYVATQKGLPQVVVEKDLWVTVLLHILFGKNGSNGILFKGGTSLSKGFNLIDRFSEDIDVTYCIDTLKNTTESLKILGITSMKMLIGQIKNSKKS